MVSAPECRREALEQRVAPAEILRYEVFEVREAVQKAVA